MDYFSDPQETVSRFGDYIEDFHDVFRCNDVDFGCPGDFFTFARRLNYDSELRCDVLRVVKTVMEGETNISFRAILTIMAVGSGGPDVTESKRQMSVPVNLIIEALTVDDARSEFKAAPSDGSYSDFSEDETAQIPTVAQIPVAAQIPTAAQIPVAAQILVASEGYSSVAGDAIDRTDLNKHCFEGTAIDPVGGLSVEQESSIDEFSSSVYAGPKTLPEILARLRSNTLRVKVFLESIEQRFSRMETRLESVQTLALSGPTVRPSDDEGEAGFYAAIAAGAKPELLDPVPPRPNQWGRGLAEFRAAVPRLWTDVRKFYSSRRQIRLSILSCAATLLFIGSLVWGFGRYTRSAVVHPVNASVEEMAKPAAVGNAPLTSSSVSDTFVASVGEAQSAAGANSPVPVDSGAHADGVVGSSVVAAGTAKGSKPAPTNSYTAQGASRPPDRPVQTSEKATRVSFKSPLPQTSSPDERASAEMTANAPAEVATPDHGYSLSSKPLSNHVIDVSSGVMAANLVSSSKPSYPRLASLIRAQGNVVMQAIISTTGSVEHVHVIKGHRLLRGAAKNAVKTWRYRPYKVNGIPVEVATIVSVEFTLNR
jgi:TonB family protein